MTDYTVGVVGTGPHPGDADHDGYSMGYRHARSYRAVDGCRLVACADVDPENAAAFADEFDLPADRAYTGLAEMLDDDDALGDDTPVVVSLCTPPATHLDLVETCLDRDAVRAIHCEKPLAPTFGESRRIVDRCADAGVQLTVNLQMRCGDAAAAVAAAVDDGVVGDLRRVEIGRRDLLQTGLHHVDVANFVLNDEPVEWVLGGIDYPEERVWYTGMHAEVQSIGTWRYESGVHALCATGEGEGAVGSGTNRFVGTDGEIAFELADEYRVRTDDAAGWRTVTVDGPPPQDRAIEDVVDALATGGVPASRGETALAATAVVFGIWESARRRGRVDLPLEIDDNPLRAMVESGDLPPEPGR